MSRPRDLPLFAWGEALRAARARRRRLRRHAIWIGLGALALGATIAFPPPPRLLWNATASAPVGFYLVSPGARLARSDMVVARAPYPARLLAARRHYLPMNVPLVKRVIGVPGDIICARGERVTLDGKLIARRLPHDNLGRALPWWEGCEGLLPGRFFLLMDRVPASFDGRYFGPVGEADIIGKASPLWLG
ncbi:conjugal transfer protein [Sphingobium amiense]|uniref:Signal peptidase I n=1 Tax=Sphingobium amiense TaxID=135719 RepID=A0A494W266_9SPHN|nr:S26 family signal peptidase [Sphingobium amiense]BBD97416.1 conjugal transfer protein [Sphingobium amiense]